MTHQQRSEAFEFFASSFLADAKCIAAKGFQSFNVSSVTDRGSFLQTVTLITDEDEIHPATGVHSTAYFALGHAIELFLKSFLLRKGLSEKKLADDLGHDLKKAMTVSQQHGLRYCYAQRVCDFSDYHRRHLFRYPLERLINVPPVEDLIVIADELEKAIKMEIA
jgi:hypothetical protein